MKSIRSILISLFLLTVLLATPAQAGLANFTISSIADTSDGTCDSHCTLREAITAANGAGSGFIEFDQGGVFATHQIIDLTAALPAITVSLTIIGPANGVTIHRNSGGNYRILDIPNPGLTIELSNLTISNGNTNNDGGGIRSLSYLELNQVTVDGNVSGDHGGGAALFAGGLIESSTISNNSAPSGGGLYFEPAPTDVVTMINSTVSGNSSPGVGTGILLANFTHMGNVSLSLYSCTVAFNPGNSQGITLYPFGAGRQATLNLGSTLLQNNGLQNLGQFPGGGTSVFNSLDFNLSSDSSAALNQPADQVNIDAFLKPLAENGGLTKTHALAFGSWALDKGKNTLRSTDQRGLPRKRDLPNIETPPGGDQSDVGAFEYNEILMVENNQDSGAGSLRAAIEAANADTDGNYIGFSTFFNNPRVIRLESALPDLLGTLTINGPGARLATVRRHSGGDYRIFTKPSGGSLEISGLTISNGKASSGGGIESHGIIRLLGVAVSGNQATFEGGGISLINVFADIYNSTIHDNRAGQGGGIAFQYDLQGNGRVTVYNSTVSGNRANIGGGLFASNNGQNNSFVFLESSTIADNQGVGGGIHADISSGTNAAIQTLLHNSIVANPGYANLSSYAAPGSTVSFVSQGFNLFSDAANGLTTTATDQLSTDPLLAPLSPNGGPTPVHALRGGSPALDRGQHGFANLPDVDQRGLSRNFDTPGIPASVGGDSSDIGAVEMHAVLVTNANDSGAGSLRQAMLDANGNGAELDDILFDSTFFSTPRLINLAGVLASITSSMNLVGPGADRANLRRNTGGDYRMITNSAPDLYIGINDMTLSNGNLPSQAGGGILSRSFLDLRRSVVSGNAAVSGGGIKMEGSGVIESSTISGNSASQAGGLVLTQGQNSMVQLVNSTVSGNTATSIPGIFLSGSTSVGTTELEVMNSTIADNTGGSPALNVDNSLNGVIATVTLANSMLSNNSGASLATFEANGGEANIISLGNNLSTDSGFGYLSGPGDLISTNPLLGPLASYGGPTPTRSMPASSPALDAANCALSGTTRDQRGKYRPFDRPASVNAADGCDIGAFEWSDADGDDAEDSQEIFQNGFEG